MYQTLKQRSGISEFMLESICRDFLEKHGRLPYLDEIPGSNSESYLKDRLKITEHGGAKITNILEIAGKETVEEAIVSINNQFRDLETTIVPINKEALVDIVHRPTDNNFDNWSEEDEILARAPRDDSGNLLAPNGKVSNLTEKQYVQVRTKAFKKWFGDWELIAYDKARLNSIPNLRKINVDSFLKAVDSKLEKDYLTTGYLNRESVEVIKKLFDLSKIQLYQGDIKEYGLSFYTGAIVLRTMKMEEAAQVFIHEILHSYTTYAYDTDATFRKEINKYHKIALSYNSGFSKDVYEFMANTLEPGHMATLLEIPSENNSSNLLKDIIKSYVRHIRAFFKTYNTRNKRTLFHDVIETIYNHKRNNSESINNISKVVDENGEPLVVYHYTDAEFDTFNIHYFGQTDPGDHGKGFYFTTTSPEQDTGYFKESYGDNAMPVFLNIKNPLYVSPHDNSKYFNRKLRPYKSHREHLLYQIDVENFIKQDIENKLYGNDEENKKYKDPEYIGTKLETRRLEQVKNKINKLKEELANLSEDYNENAEYNAIIEELNQYDGVINNDFEIVVPNPNQIKSATSNSGSFNRLSGNIYDTEPNDYLVLNNTLQKLAELYGINFNTVTDAELNSERWANLMPESRLVNAFIYDGQIYINIDRANLDAPLHEMLHIFVGSMRFTNPDMYQELIQLSERFPNYDKLTSQFSGKTRNDINEEIFITEISKHLTGQKSALTGIDEKLMYEISYNVHRVLDSVLMGTESSRTITDDILYTLSLKDLAFELNSAIMTNNIPPLRDSELHRTLNNMKSDLIKEGKLKEICD